MSIASLSLTPKQTAPSETIQPHPALPTRILAVYFPWLETDRIMRKRLGPAWRKQDRKNHAPIVHVHKHKSAMRIAAMDECAASLGLRRHQGLADAQAQFPDLDVIAYQPEADQRLLTAIADWCDRYTPLIAFDGDYGLLLDITGCAHLFGGEHAMVRDLLIRLFDQGFYARAAAACTAGAAHAVARFGANDGPAHISSGQEAKMLAPFGLAALRLSPETVDGLARVGIKTIGQLKNTARAPVARRFGRQCLIRLDQALGGLDEVLSPRLPVADLAAERRLAEPVTDHTAIRHLIYKLALTIKLDMERRSVGGRSFGLALFRIDGAVRRLTVGASRPLRDPERITALFTERLDALGDDMDVGYGFDVIRLTVCDHDPVEPTQEDFSASENDHPDISALMDRIAARMGNNTGTSHPVHQIMAVQNHIPERAEQRIPFRIMCGGQQNDQKPTLTSRPLRLLQHPEPIDVMAEVPEGAPMRFVWRRVTSQVARAEGPERIAGQWWGTDDEIDEALMTRPRDYYRVEDREGYRYWIFRSGLYIARGTIDAQPRWYMHGLFA